ILFFFFSSRRRHTRLQGDWSSDVCSSDLRWRERFPPWWFEGSWTGRKEFPPQYRGASAQAGLGRGRKAAGVDIVAGVDRKPVDGFTLVIAVRLEALAEISRKRERGVRSRTRGGHVHGSN